MGIYLLVLNVFARPPKNTKTQDPSHPFESSHLSHLAAGGGGPRDACACRPDMQSVPHSPLFLLFWQAPGVRHGTPSSIPAIAVQLVAARFSTRNPRTAALDMQGMIFRFHLPPVVHRTSAWKPRRDGCAARRVRRSQPRFLLRARTLQRSVRTCAVKLRFCHSMCHAYTQPPDTVLSRFMVVSTSSALLF